ncbi:hypothetical protein SL267_22260 [Serratia marcescens]|jgi:hypothetical protein|uniref:hypothetical protein n=1 Tax=Serratia TaxID=613 RepID=UPI00044D71E6|nr:MULTISPECIES: hypothetical protein [Serratia]KAB5496754.1 hypothetical protein F8564_12770 [Enterobacter sp. RJAL6]ALD46940.1 hypothetical protein AN479_22050 [Serratia marcescens]ASM02274.1 hypothetical protein BVG88_08955 [Serratia marcescens]EMB2347443.1 hypothetical protein [Serratia marcescens]EMD1303255.1 hypothetical protein [Serratia marcescens]
MKVQAIKTKYGIIQGRDALIISEHEVSLSPFTFKIKALLSSSACELEVLNEADVKIEFFFSDIERMSIYKVDDYPYEKYSESSFDLLEEYSSGKARVALSTYDHVFDVTGSFKILYE